MKILLCDRDTALLDWLSREIPWAELGVRTVFRAGNAAEA